jgi:hypothetical protein
MANNKVSTLVKQSIPYFIREDHPNFAKFIQSYYKFLEEPVADFKKGRPIERVLNHLKNIDIDHTSHEEAADYLYRKFIQDIPLNIEADKAILLKNIKDFYRSKGTEGATKFLIYILTGFTDTEIYYPKQDILRASDGKWYVQKSLRVSNTFINGVSNTLLTGLEKYVGTRIRGNTSNATAIVESIDRYFIKGSKVDEVILSNIDGDFFNGEKIIASYNSDDNQIPMQSDVFGGIVNSIRVINGGSNYQVGDPAYIISSQGNGACALVTSTSTGNISSLIILDGGAGFQHNSSMILTGGGGSGANAYVSSINNDETYHPNTYNIVASVVSLEGNTVVGNAVYSNLNFGVADPANNWVANSMLYFNYTNVGPVSSVIVTNPGQNYIDAPLIDVVANSTIKSLGILGRMRIWNGGLGYTNGDIIEFIGGDGYGAQANVVNTYANGKIRVVKFKPVPGFPVGGVGYRQDNLPIANVITSTGNGANIMLTAILGDGERFLTANSTLGTIERISVLDGGSDYSAPPYVDLTGSGDGLATANASVIEGVYQYPGRFLNDDGFLSSYNFLQDRDFYQLFSYVIKTGVSFSSYEDVLKKLVHPSGIKMFGEYQLNDIQEDVDVSITTEEATQIIILTKPYEKTGNLINISYTSHSLSNNMNIRLEFITGDMANLVNGIYAVTTVNANVFMVTANNLSNTSGNVEVGITR